MGSDKFKNELDGLRKDLKRFETKDSGFDNKLNELKSSMNKLENMGIPEFKKEDDSFMNKGKSNAAKEPEKPKEKTETKEPKKEDKKSIASETVGSGKPTSKTKSNKKEKSKVSEKKEEEKKEEKLTAEQAKIIDKSKKQEKKPETRQTDKSESKEEAQKREPEKPVETGISKLKDTFSSSTDEKIDKLQDSILHLDEALKNLISIFSNATKELGEDPDKELKVKMDKIIEQNDKILSRLDEKPKSTVKEELSGSPFLPKANLPPEMEPVKYHSAPKPPEDDTIPRLKPRKGKYNV